MSEGLRQHWERLKAWYQLSRSARAETEKGTSAQIRDLIRLRLGAGRLGVREYYGFGLYDDQRFPLDAKQRFIGRRGMAKLYRRVNQGNWHGLSDDKLIFYSLLQALGFPYPRIFAVYHPGGRPFGGAPCLRDPRALSAFLRDEVEYPFFLKPCRSKYGVGAAAVVAFRDSALILADGQSVQLETYLNDSRLNVDRFGLILQERLAPHPTLERLCGHRLSSIRLVVLLCHDGPRALHAVWKIPTGVNMTDNFQHGASGNLLGYVDIATGVVERVVGSQAVTIAHPDTGLSLSGVTLPDWGGLIGTALEAAKALPGLRWQNWDIAMSTSGPVILEMNAFADVDLVQHARGTGLNDAVLATYLTQIAP